MILFFISFLLVFLTSYFITSIIASKKNILCLIYLFLIAFAQVVLIFELLSIFNSINIPSVLVVNIVVFISTVIIWLKKQKPLFALNLLGFKNKILNSFKLDKSLLFLAIGFIVLIVSAIILGLIMPVTSADGHTYHVARCAFWIMQESLKHFDTPDIRMLCLPINSEILYSWVILFTKKDVFLGLFSFVGYFLAIVSIFNIMGYLGYCYRKRLWVIFILSSLPSVLVQASSTETDIIIAGLISSSILLFWNSLKTGEKIPVFMSSLAYALAIGTKTPALIMIPGVGLLFLGLSIYYKNYEKLKLFLIFGIINFILFASYNYILNFIHFSNIFGSESFILVSKNYYGLKGLFANVVKYVFMFADFTGFKWGLYLGPHIEHTRLSLLNLLHLNMVKDGIYNSKTLINYTLIEPLIGSGILGFIVFLPTLFWSLVKPIFKHHSKKTNFLLAFGLLFVINIILLSSNLTYMTFSVRFIMSFIVVSSPILVYSYLSNKNPLKYIVLIFAMFYLTCISTHLWARPFTYILKELFESKSITQIRLNSRCNDLTVPNSTSDSLCILRKDIKKYYSKNNSFLALISSSDYIYDVKSLEFEGYKIDFKTLEDVNKIDFNKYNIIFAPNTSQVSTVIKNFDPKNNNYTIYNSYALLNQNSKTSCYYVKNSFIPNNSNTQPYQVRCNMTESFVKSKNMNIIGFVGVADNPDKKNDYYVIYENTKKPAIIIKN